MAKKYRKLRHDIGFIAVSALVFAAKKTPRFLGLRLFALLGLLLGFCLKKERAIAAKNLKTTFPDYDGKKIEAIINGVFINTGKTLFDSIKVPEYPKEKFFKIVQLDQKARDYLSKHDGAIFLCSHLAAFELQSQAAVMLYPNVMAVGARQFDRRVDDLIVDLRQRNGVKYYDRDGAIMNVLRNLKEKYSVGFLVDQDATNEGVFVNFLGRPAWTPYIPVKIAVRSKVQLLHAFFIREKGDKYTLNIEKADLVVTENEMETYMLNLEKFNEKLGEYVKKYPEQWVWMHERWKRKPQDFDPELSISYYKNKNAKGEEK